MSEKIALKRIRAVRESEAEQLNLGGLGLRRVPGEIAELSHLKELYLRASQLTEIPQQILQLTNLQTLGLNSNQLSELPSEIGQLTNLQILYLNSNQLSELPPELGDIKSLRRVGLAANSAKLDPLAKLATQDLDRFKAYLQSLQDAERLYEAKILLVGEGAVGKSSLLAAMKEEGFEEDRDTTHGIEVRRLSLPHPKLANTDLDLRAWDFGGQPVYRISHQFFYSPRALYLVLWEPRRGPDGCEVEQWIQRIKLRVGDAARVLVVATHCQAGYRFPRIDEKVLLRDHGDVIEGFCEVDSLTGHGIEELKKAIAETASQLPQMGDLFSTRWKAVREALRDLKDQEKKSHVPLSEAMEVGSDLADIEIETLLSLLNDVGDLIYFGDDEGLRDHLILDPEWLSKAISLVLEDTPTNLAKGVLDHSRLPDIWEHHEKKDQPSYARDLHPYLLRLMEKHDVSYRLENGTESLVSQLVPDVLPDDLPWTADDPVDSEAKGQVRLICDLNETPPPGLIPWLIVRTHRWATKPRQHWQRGSFLEYAGHGEGLLELRDRALHITVRAAWPQYFMTVLIETMKTLAEARWPGLVVTYKVPCYSDRNGGRCSGTFPLDGVQRRSRRGKLEVPCLVCDEDLSLAKLLTGFRPASELLDEIRKIGKNQKALLSAVTESHTALLRVLSTETIAGPRIFTLLPEEAKGLKGIGKIGQRLTLWCEHPDEPHPTCQIGSGGTGEYTFNSSKEWLVKVAPLADRILTAVKILVPVGGAIAWNVLDKTVFDDLKPKLALAGQFTSKILPDSIEAPDAVDETDEMRTTVEGAALREFHEMLHELDPKKRWGDLRRVLAPTGDYLWLCPSHYKEYDPGLPDLSGSRGKEG